MKPSMGPKNHTQVVVVYYLPPLVAWDSSGLAASMEKATLCW